GWHEIPCRLVYTASWSQAGFTAKWIVYGRRITDICSLADFGPGDYWFSFGGDRCFLCSSSRLQRRWKVKDNVSGSSDSSSVYIRLLRITGRASCNRIGRRSYQFKNFIYHSRIYGAL